MKDWKVRQKIYHQLNPYDEIGDDLKKQKLVEEWDPEVIVQRALEYPFVQSETLSYPGKSFAVAVIYAQLIAAHFKEEIRELLNDPELLFGNDPYFQIYQEAPQIYDRILEKFPKILASENVWSDDMRLTLQYFQSEFLLEENVSSS